MRLAHPGPMFSGSALPAPWNRAANGASDFQQQPLTITRAGTQPFNESAEEAS